MPPSVDPLLAPLEQYPPVHHHLGWLLLAAACLVGAIVVAMAARRLCRRLEGNGGERSTILMEAVRSTALAELERLQTGLEVGTISQGAAHRRLGEILRRCVATWESSNLDFEGLDEIEQRAAANPRLRPLAQILRASQAPAFDSRSVGDASARIDEAREVIRTW